MFDINFFKFTLFADDCFGFGFGFSSSNKRSEHANHQQVVWVRDWKFSVSVSVSVEYFGSV
jgi:hypothetical protein